MLRSSVNDTPNQFVLFVAGEPEMAPGVRDSGVGLLSRLGAMTGTFSPGFDEKVWDPNLQTPTDHRPWHLPPAQMACLQMTLDAAKSRRRRVLVIDVNRPGERQDLVDRWVGPEDVFPLLVRGDGARIEGAENFHPAKVRRLLAGR